MQEVSDEVRRDRLFGLFRSYGWIGICLILLLVGGAAVNEWKKTKDKAFAELNGDELRQILNNFSGSSDTEPYLSYLDKNLPGKTLAVLNPIFLTSGNKIPEKLTHLKGVSNNLDLPIALRDLALLYRFYLLQSDFEEKMDTLKILAGPDKPYRLLAIEAKIDLLLSKNLFKEALTEVKLLENEIYSSLEMKNRVQNLKRIIQDYSKSD
mgnify:CR=1 FL=1